MVYFQDRMGSLHVWNDGWPWDVEGCSTCVPTINGKQADTFLQDSQDIEAEIAHLPHSYRRDLRNGWPTRYPMSNQQLARRKREA